MIDLLRQLSSIQWQIQAGAVWGKCPPPNVCGAPVNGVLLIKMRPALVPIKVETDLKYFNSLNFRLYLPDIYSGFYSGSLFVE